MPLTIWAAMRDGSTVPPALDGGEAVGRDKGEGARAQADQNVGAVARDLLPDLPLDANQGAKDKCRQQQPDFHQRGRRI